MKRLLLLAFLFSFYHTRPAFAQARYLAGATGGVMLGNESLGVSAAAEVPFAKRYEWDAIGIYSPIETHIGLGNGWSGSAAVGGLAWLTSAIGVASSVEVAHYSVQHAAKTESFLYLGPTWRRTLWGAPARINISYVREIANGISANGTESNRLQGVRLSYEGRVGCAGSFCFRLGEEIVAAHFLNQSNPVCDGTFGVTGGPNGGPCPRTGAWSGGTTAWFRVEWPRPRGRENEVF